MTVQAVTTWEGSVKGLELLVEGAKQSGPYHESLGAKTLDSGELVLAEMLSEPTTPSSSIPTKLMANLRIA